MSWFNPFSWGKDRRERNIDFPNLNIKTYRTEDRSSFFDNLGTPCRDDALEYVPLSRCITLLVNQCAELVSGGLRVVDRNGDLVDTEYSKHALRMLQETPNGYQSGHDFIRAIASDFLIDGNSLVLVERSDMVDRGGTARIRALSRLDSDTATVVIGDSMNGLSSVVYHTRRYGNNTIEVLPASKIAHAVIMPPPSSTGDGSQRQFFSRSSLYYLRKAIYIGRKSDAWVGDFFDEGARNNMAISFPMEMSKEMQERQVKAYNHTLTNKRSPLFLWGGATVQTLNPTPQDADANVLREYGVQEIGRFYGVPAPLIGLHVTQWGSGIEQLARLHYRFSARQHLGVILDSLSFRILPNGQRFEVDSAQEVRGDTEAMAKLASAVKPSPNGPAIMSLNELRKTMGLYGEFKDDWNYDPQGKEPADQPLDKSDDMM